MEGFPDLKVKSMMEYKEQLEKNFDCYRSALMCEPRGHKDMVGALLVKPLSKEADMGVIYMDANRWINMCGHATIGVSMALVNEKMVKIHAPVTHLKLETPAGMIEVDVEIENDRAKSVSFVNVPSLLFQDGCSVENIHFDISYSGSFFALVDASQFDKDISMHTVRYYQNLGINLLKKINHKYHVKHPILSIERVVNIEFYQKTCKGQKNIVISEEGMIDRSPCGTGTCAKLAYMFTTGKLKLNEDFINESFTGVYFMGKVISETTVGPYKAIIPKIKGIAYIDGYNTFVLDDKDPLKYGFLI